MAKKTQGLKAMKRRLRNLTFFGLVLVFTGGILCSTLAAPSQSLAAVTGCFEDSGAMAMAGCENPSYLCGFGSPSNLFSRGALSSARSDDLLKNALSLLVGEAPLAASNDGALLIGNGRSNPSVIGPRKVSTRLFNSVLNL